MPRTTTTKNASDRYSTSSRYPSEITAFIPLLPIANAIEPNAPSGANFMMTSTNLKNRSDIRFSAPSTLARCSLPSISNAAPRPIEMTST